MLHNVDQMIALFYQVVALCSNIAAVSRPLFSSHTNLYFFGIRIIAFRLAKAVAKPPDI